MANLVLWKWDLIYVSWKSFYKIKRIILGLLYEVRDGAVTCFSLSAGDHSWRCYPGAPSLSLSPLSRPYPFRQSSDPLPTHNEYFPVWPNQYVCVCVLTFSLLNQICYHFMYLIHVCIQHAGLRARAYSEISIPHAHISMPHILQCLWKRHYVCPYPTG